MNFLDKLKNKWNQGKFVCVGLDPYYSKIPDSFKENISISEAIFNFNKSIINQTADLVLCYKPQSSFYEAYGIEGLTALKKTVEYIKKNNKEKGPALVGVELKDKKDFEPFIKRMRIGV